MARAIATEAERLEAVWHVVYEYANLISSGELLREQFRLPINTHLQDAFLLNCRKMADFFAQNRKKDDVIAEDFTASRVDFDLSFWETWSEAMDKQLAHITYTRVRNPKGWDGSANEPLLKEFRSACTKFLDSLAEPFKSRFEQEIRTRQRSGDGFENLDLGIAL
ncbi:MAG: hypothetical protein ABSD98_00440 [Candidatus Korobacteraceae bacterium]|jgi:hypothetical protein